MSLDTEQFEARLTSHGVYVSSVEQEQNQDRDRENEEGNGTIDIEYESIDAGRIGEVPHQEMGRVINVYREVAENSADIDALVTDLDDEPVGTWHVESEWLDALDAGELSEVEFSGRVLDTIDHDVEN
ncbi:hypothetical protein BRC86_00820 [Halobacteriales archaeon QS_3_64_16]|nr:MAG: hypothetical protein BRC86_00820 [Halobacteriales archaeon QS_3_64_16]